MKFLPLLLSLWITKCAAVFIGLASRGNIDYKSGIYDGVSYEGGHNYDTDYHQGIDSRSLQTTKLVRQPTVAVVPQKVNPIEAIPAQQDIAYGVSKQGERVKYFKVIPWDPQLNVGGAIADEPEGKIIKIVQEPQYLESVNNFGRGGKTIQFVAEDNGLNAGAHFKQALSDYQDNDYPVVGYQNNVHSDGYKSNGYYVYDNKADSYHIDANTGGYKDNDYTNGGYHRTVYSGIHSDNGYPAADYHDSVSSGGYKDEAYAASRLTHRVTPTALYTAPVSSHSVGVRKTFNIFGGFGIGAAKSFGPSIGFSWY